MTWQRSTRAGREPSTQRNATIAVAILTVILTGAIGVMGCARRGIAGTVAPSPGLLPQTRIGVGVDVSKSMDGAHTEPPTRADLVDLTKVVRTTGGDLALAIIDAASRDPLLRLHVDPPPIPPRRPDACDDTIAEAEAASSYARTRRAYEEQFQGWEAIADAACAAFVELAVERIGRPRARATALVQGVTRLDVFLAEPTPSGRKAPRLFLVVLSDGKETVAPKAVLALRSRPTVIQIHASGSAGLLAPLMPLRFEAPAAAIAYVQREVQP